MVDIVTGSLQHIGDAIDFELQKPGEHGSGIAAGIRMFLGIGDEAPERQRIGIAYGHERITRQNIGDLRVLRALGIEFGDDGRCHIERAFVLV